MKHVDIARRDLLKTGGAVVVAFSVPTALLGGAKSALARAPNRPLDPAALDSWIAVSEDNTVTVFWGKMDMGQGTDTGIAMMAEEELDVDIDRVNIIQGDTALTVDQGGASGSTGLQRSGVAIRFAAAEARRVLVEMASENLEVPAEGLTVRDGTVVAMADPSKSVTYGDLVGNGYFSTQLDWNGRFGNSLALKGLAEPKSPDQYTLIGTNVARKDVTGKIVPTTSYAHHMTVAGMMHGRMIRPPQAGAYPTAVDESSIAGIGAKVVWKDHFLGVVAEREWDAIRASEQLAVTWSDPGPALQTTTAAVHDYIRQAPIMDEDIDTDEGDVIAALEEAATTVTGRIPVAVPKPCAHGTGVRSRRRARRRRDDLDGLAEAAFGAAGCVRRSGPPFGKRSGDLDAGTRVVIAALTTLTPLRNNTTFRPCSVPTENSTPFTEYAAASSSSLLRTDNSGA